jgi:ribosomal protein S18 acetylase RimI-like enzyme
VAVLRALCWPEDRKSLLALDTSFSTDRIYRLEERHRSFTLEEVPVAPALHKSYSIDTELETLNTLDWVQVASDDETVVGLVAMKLQHWNKRADLCHLYIAPAARRQGVGRAMIEAAVLEAKRRDMRCLWVETQTINYGAVRFYESTSFRLCRFDTSLYDPSKVFDGEIPLFFSQVV